MPTFTSAVSVNVGAADGAVTNAERTTRGGGVRVRSHTAPPATTAVDSIAPTTAKRAQGPRRDRCSSSVTGRGAGGAQRRLLLQHEQGRSEITEARAWIARQAASQQRADRGWQLRRQ